MRVLFLFNLIPNQMVVLKTPSQVKSFVKRMDIKHSYNFSEGCGCCGHSSYVARRKNRIIIESWSENMGAIEITATVIAVLKGRAR